MSEKKLFPKIKRVLEFAWNNPYSTFYKEKYRQAGVHPLKDIQNLSDFQKLPMLTRSELVKIDPYERIFVSKDKIYKPKISGGTTEAQDPLIIFRDRGGADDISGRGRMRTYGAKVCMLLSPVLGGGQGRLITATRSRMSERIVVLADKGNLALSAKIAKTLRVDALHGSSTFLMFFIPYLKKYYDPSKILYIRLGGEFCSEVKAAYFREVFPYAHFDFSFASTEIGANGYRCDHLADSPPRFFHPMPHIYYEFLHPDEESESVVTNLRVPIAFPAIRYRTGDSVRMTQNVCTCGKTIMEVFGKVGFDVARISGTTMYAYEIAKVLEPFKKELAMPDFQMHVYETRQGNKIMPKLVLHVVLKNIKKKETLEKIKATMEKKISENLYLSATLTLADLVKRGVFLPLTVEFVESLSFSGKRKHIVSHIV